MIVVAGLAAIFSCGFLCGVIFAAWQQTKLERFEEQQRLRRMRRWQQSGPWASVN
jgi:hypothetical protein